MQSIIPTAWMYLWLIVSERTNGDRAIAVATFTDIRKSSRSEHKRSSTIQAIRELVAWTKVVTVRG